MLGLSIESTQIYNINKLYELGFRAINYNSIMKLNMPTIAGTVLLANFPQFVLSILYMIYNSMYSCMLGAYEWSRFAHHRKSLQVTSPDGTQRETYYLQLPYTYAIVRL